jgi:hypothetical protein
MKFRTVALAAAFWVGAGGLAMACQGTTILFQDSFERLQPTWGQESELLRVVGGQLEVAPAEDSYHWAANSANLYDDIDMCVTMTTIQSGDPVEAKAGLIFWYVDVNNFYVFELSPNGMASVWRRQRGKWLEQVAWREAAGANKGDAAINELRVTTVGDTATFYVNGQQFEELEGTAPENGQQIGLFAASPPTGQARFGFDNLKVTKP